MYAPFGVRIASWDSVSTSNHGLDQVGLPEFPTQAGQGHRDRAAERIGVLVPYSFEKLLGADDGAIGHEQDFEESEFLAVERNRGPRSAHPATGVIEDEVPPHGDGGVRWASPCQGVDSSHQF